MAFRAGFLSGFGAGYYLGARAGRQRYEQIQRALAQARRSPVVETATEKATEKVRSVLHRDGDGGPGEPAANLPVPAPETSVEVPAGNSVVDPEDYSSSR
ncbi:MAG: hypothetical protein M3O23_11985 [Actinomycetota bacterium]|nr:hypothetical protein [Actinomycetota bacterium]